MNKQLAVVNTLFSWWKKQCLGLWEWNSTAGTSSVGLAAKAVNFREPGRSAKPSSVQGAYLWLNKSCAHSNRCSICVKWVHEQLTKWRKEFGWEEMTFSEPLTDISTPNWPSSLSVGFWVQIKRLELSPLSVKWDFEEKSLFNEQETDFRRRLPVGSWALPHLLTQMLSCWWVKYKFFLCGSLDTLPATTSCFTAFYFGSEMFKIFRDKSS